MTLHRHKGKNRERITTLTANVEQIEYWNGAMGEKWARSQEALDVSLERITQSLLPWASPLPGERVLDIGCGCGATTLMLAGAVAPSGSVMGVDISRPMLAAARSSAETAGLPVEYAEADAAVHAFEPEFNLVFSRFGVMFFDDPIAAFANIRRAVAPGGRLAFVCWRAMQGNHWVSTPLASAIDLLTPEDPGDPHDPGPFAFADKARIEQILSSAGFCDIRIEPLDSVTITGSTVQEAVAQSLEIGPLARRAAGLEESVRDVIRERVAAAIAPFAGPDGVALPAACWLVGANVTLG
jgi:SAM-dependent methyltransferase